MHDPEYVAITVIADQMFDQRSTELLKALDAVVEAHAARGFPALSGPAIGVMSEATVKALRASSEELLGFYERAFVERPPVSAETRNAIQSKLADHVCGQMESLVATYEGHVETRGGGNAVDAAVKHALTGVRHQIQARVAALRAKLG